jgi:hypothetical protein
LSKAGASAAGAARTSQGMSSSQRRAASPMFFPETHNRDQTIRNASTAEFRNGVRQHRAMPISASVPSGAPTARYNSTGLTSSQVQYVR